MGGDGTQYRQAQSSVLGVAFLVAIVLAVSVTVLLVGGALVQESRSSTSMESASMAMSELDAQVDAVRSERSSSTTVDIRGAPGDEVSVQPGAGSVTVTVEDPSGTLADRTFDMGRIVYESGDGDLVAYQGGGVWRTARDSSESAMVSPPTFEYHDRRDDPTLSFPVVRVDGSATDGEFTIRQDGSTDDPFSGGGPGAVVGDVTSTNSGTEIHFDENLVGRPVGGVDGGGGGGGAAPSSRRVVYLYVSETTLTVED